MSHTISTEAKLNILKNARSFILNNARMVERLVYQIEFEEADKSRLASMMRQYQNPDGGLGHALEPDLRCSESQPLFIGMGLDILYNSKVIDSDLGSSVCTYLEALADEDGLVPIFLPSAMISPMADHWKGIVPTPSFNPTAGICGHLHYMGVAHPWLDKATKTCINILMNDTPVEAHSLQNALYLAQNLPDKGLGAKMIEIVAEALPKAGFFIPHAPVEGYGLTPLDFAPSPTSPMRVFFSDEQISGHLQDLIAKVEADGGWPISWGAPGSGAVNEWRGIVTLNAIIRLRNYGVL